VKKWEDRQTNRIPLPPTDQEADEYREWSLKRAALTEQGLERGWLDYGYEGDTYLGPKPVYEERPETDEEYESRMNDSVARYYWNMMRDMAKQFKKESENLAILSDEYKDKRGDGYVTSPVVNRKDDL